MNKLDDYLKKQLSNYSPSDDGWNIPDEALWDKAKEHFPKENKKKRFFWWFFGFGILVFVTSFILLSNILEDNNSTGIHGLSIQKEEKKSSKPLSKEEPLQDSNINTVRTELSQDAQQDQEEQIKNMGLTSKNVSTHKSNLDNRKPGDDEFVFNRNIENEEGQRESIVHEEEPVNKKIETKDILTQSSKNNISGQYISKKTPDNQQNLYLNNQREETQIYSINNANIETTTTNKPLHFKLANQIPLSPLSFSHLFPKLEYDILLNPVKKRKRWEVGIAHTSFFINPSETLFADDEEPDDSYDIQVSVLNFNLSVMRRFRRPFSIQTGLYYTRFNADISFTSTDIYDENGDDLETIVRQQSSGSIISIEDESQEIDVELLPGVTVENGDEVTIQAFIPLKLKVIQIPILFNYHFHQKKWEWYFGAGPSIDFYTASINFADIKVIKDKEVITKPINFDPLSTSQIGISIYSGLGVKYHFNDNFNIGLSSKVDMAALPLSRYEMGLYYVF